MEGLAESVEKAEERAALPLFQIDLLSSLNDGFAHTFMLNRWALSKEWAPNYLKNIWRG